MDTILSILLAGMIVEFAIIGVYFARQARKAMAEIREMSGVVYRIHALAHEVHADVLRRASRRAKRLKKNQDAIINRAKEDWTAILPRADTTEGKTDHGASFITDPEPYYGPNKPE